jgi:type IV pilus assembly protein PilV
MLMPARNFRLRGSTLLEVLVTLGILAFGLLGLAGLQNKMQVSNVEAYQRAQAVMLMSDMVERMNVAPAIDASAASCYAMASQALTDTCLAQRVEGYVSSTVFGTGDSQTTPCPTAVGPARDQCEWSGALKGANEMRSSTSTGAMTGARGCVTKLQAPDPTAGVCTPGIYLVTVAWQGFNKTVAQANTCAQDLYGNDAYRRAISARVVVGLPGCL